LNLAVLFQTGLGVPLDYTEAYKWFTLAANAGLANSRHALKELTQIMTTAQSRDGRARISDWMSHHSNLELGAQRAAVKELDSYAISAQP
jgi:TPR repeat protein